MSKEIFRTKAPVRATRKKKLKPTERTWGETVTIGREGSRVIITVYCRDDFRAAKLWEEICEERLSKELSLFWGPGAP